MKKLFIMLAMIFAVSWLSLRQPILPQPRLTLRQHLLRAKKV